MSLLTTLPIIREEGSSQEAHRAKLHCTFCSYSQHLCFIYGSFSFVNWTQHLKEYFLINTNAYIKVYQYRKHYIVINITISVLQTEKELMNFQTHLYFNEVSCGYSREQCFSLSSIQKEIVSVLRSLFSNMISKSGTKF